MPIASVGMIARESKMPSQPPAGSQPSASASTTMRSETRTNGGVASVAPVPLRGGGGTRKKVEDSGGGGRGLDAGRGRRHSAHLQKGRPPMKGALSPAPASTSLLLYVDEVCLDPPEDAEVVEAL